LDEARAVLNPHALVDVALDDDDVVADIIR
jgi:hypothetical protein